MPPPGPGLCRNAQHSAIFMGDSGVEGTPQNLGPSDLRGGLGLSRTPQVALDMSQPPLPAPSVTMCRWAQDWLTGLQDFKELGSAKLWWGTQQQMPSGFMMPSFWGWASAQAVLK